MDDDILTVQYLILLAQDSALRYVENSDRTSCRSSRGLDVAISTYGVLLTTVGTQLLRVRNKNWEPALGKDASGTVMLGLPAPPDVHIDTSYGITVKDLDKQCLTLPLLYDRRIWVSSNVMIAGSLEQRHGFTCKLKRESWEDRVRRKWDA